jgi:hypothetical protein
MDPSLVLLSRSATGSNRLERQRAFWGLLSSERWAEALSPEVIAEQGYAVRDDVMPDIATLEGAAAIIAGGGEEKLHHLLGMVGPRFTSELVEFVARRLGPAFVEHGLAHLRSAEGERAVLLQRALDVADPAWVRLPGAKRVIKKRLRTPADGRIALLSSLAVAGNLGEHLDEILESPPSDLQEWAAIGRSALSDPRLVGLALLRLREGPEPLAYLLSLDPPPAVVESRMLAAARPDWLLSALEIAIALRLEHPSLVHLAELGVKLGGRPMSAAVAWLGTAHLSKRLLHNLGQLVRQVKGQDRLDDLLWVRRSAPSGHNAQEKGRRGEPPDLLDAAALVRQLRGEEVPKLVREILEKPLPTLMEPVLRPLCSLNAEAAAEVAALSRSVRPEIAKRAREALEWPDVEWPALPDDEL